MVTFYALKFYDVQYCILPSSWFERSRVESPPSETTDLDALASEVQPSALQVP